jgi:hydrogenase maturation protease
MTGSASPSCSFLRSAACHPGAGRRFGIRGLDLVYPLLDGYSAAILSDAVEHGDPPGTLSIIEPETPRLAYPEGDDPESGQELLLSPHEMDPEKVLRLAALLGGNCRRVLLIGCEAG